VARPDDGNDRPDVVLMDYALPDGDGGATAAAIVRERPATKVSLVTGSDASEGSAAPSR
jgi:DNA-binding NarL/FixJ family response regulator